jgi:hypothetical protein
VTPIDLIPLSALPVRYMCSPGVGTFGGLNAWTISEISEQIQHILYLVEHVHVFFMQFMVFFQKYKRFF